ncbi:hypothetical protein KAR91_75625 [Candidatus Pacearchaeota archaeon]|nr:hypothetical protein [Candidatus Pacearchaeota archaeon]
MAKLRSGILGNVRGKVAGVVGSQWKDVNYIREFVKPANPNTAAQQTQRTKMSDVVAFCKPLVGPVFNQYTDKFQKSMSGFNFFIKSSIAEFDGSVDYSALKLTEGKLYGLDDLEAIVPPANPTLEITWTENIGNNGALTDPVYAAAYDSDTGLWYFPAAEVTRDDEQIDITVPTTITASSMQCYAWAIKMSGTLVDLISDSAFDEAAIA